MATVFSRLSSVLNISLPAALLFLLLTCIVRHTYWQLTVGARQRRLIRENGCKEPRWYPHKGIFGRMFGFDTMKQNIDAARAGHLHELVRSRNYAGGNTMKMRVFRRDFITTIEPENVKTVLSTNFGDYGLGKLRHEVMAPVFGDGIFTTDGHAWERSRAMIRPNFTRQQVGDLSVYETHVQHMLDLIPRDGQTFDLQELFFRLTMDSATQFLFGKSTNTLIPHMAHKNSDRFSDAFTYTTQAMAKDFRTARLNRYIPDRKRAEDTEFIRQFADQIVQEALAKQSSVEKEATDTQQQYTFLYELLKTTRDPYVLRSETLNLLLAGRDTTASLLSHTFFQLARRPDVWARLHEEIADLHGEAPDYETLKGIKYVKWVLNESLRLYPVVPGNTRIANKDTILPLGGGPDEKSPVFVAKGTPISYNTWSMHRRKDFYGEDAEEYKPERWEKLRPGWEYLPFNGGPRICIGM